ncbi:hypothetical protein CspeluHIS016_0500020 [Cutaneotrichosporon spelunceum]|uniref:monoamine oxidase n=1 Tax=Cutaneotrichosporon spelunceum TaxID=1672016 RepID=A0AAD3TWV0_9TREE|nr:hypothetical protein CspeluHIS016_0500020 [Cutaneotrichosporon spelunceum]
MQNTVGNAIFYAPQHGIRVLAEDGADDPLSKDNPLYEIYLKMDKLSQTVDLEDPSRTPGALDLDALSMYSWFREQGASADEIALFLDPSMNALVSLDASELSSLGQLAAIKMCGGWRNMIASNARGAQYQRTRNGNQSLATFLQSTLLPGTVRLSTPVSTIERTESSVKVTTAKGVFTSSAIILGMGPTMYSGIRFEPPLGMVNRLSVERSFNGVYSKCILVYDKLWWTEKGLSGTPSTPEGYTHVTFDTSDGVHPSSGDKAALAAGLSPRQYSLTAFLVGPRGAEWALLSPEDRKAAAISEVAGAFESEDAKNPT